MQFDFGKNWLNFSKKALTTEKVEQAKQDFEKLFHDIELSGKTFADIGFGQGLSLLIAKQKGATVIGCEINPTCEQALEQTLTYFPEFELTDIAWIKGSILNQDTVEQLLQHSESQRFDVVHSWGVLHHTGKMQKAIKNASSLVKENGYLIISIYNKHWTSPIWLVIKWLYNKLPSFLQKATAYLFYPIIWLAKYLVTGENPTKMNRGMDFFYNVVDWVGGYPYEYASKTEIAHLIEPLGFELIHFVPAQVPTGCNEFVFRKNG
jgi:2-polyprenyl-3-methyl-5-hydroxy-6-metoxy-1,4-benzoquinol methylase